MIDLPREMTELDLCAVEAVAAYHERLASACRARARALDEALQRQSRADARAEALRACGLAVLDKLSMGYNSLESAVEAVARETDAPAFAVLAQYQRAVLSRARAARAARDAVIINLVRMGLTNGQIAERLGVHRNTVSSAIGAALSPHLRPADRARLRKRRK